MSRRLVALLGVTCLLLLGLGSAIATGHGDGGGQKGDHHSGDHPGDHQNASAALFAELSGRNELDATTGQPGAGDPDGFGSASFTFDGNQVCFGITVANLDAPVAAHIHSGRKFENGPVVVPLTQPATGDPGASSGCVAIDPALAADIQAHPRAYYANVHTTAFPAGAVRGQLKPLRHGHFHD
jgi:CHRD domain-containing protein